MKQFVTFSITILLTFLISGVAFGLNSPTFTSGQNTIALSVIGTQVSDLKLDYEYDFNEDWAITCDYRRSGFKKLGMKYSQNPDLALVGGYITKSTTPYLGMIGAMPLTEDLQGLGEFDLYLYHDTMTIDYELGAKLVFSQRWVLHFGLIGSTTDSSSTNELQIGMGYQF